METIRTATLADCEGLLALYSELRPNDPKISNELAVSTLQAMLENPQIALIVVEENQQLIASCMLGLIPTLTNGARPFAMIEHVITNSRCRSKGIGSRMLRFAVDLAWQKNCYKVMLLSGMQRTEAHRVYEKLGFRGDVEIGYALKPEWYLPSS
ncbi:GNAT family N-acetyltransferase [Cellvibrio sp. KY-GH-1]|uniref:GNAT family N-acetyltransferase n=1 Tax=Cellvibrio sp. KY-GH-1 TaxID=2303332 RepID=UPI001246B285|nr:GNAT family N-acetyltransferase [Cellvibrio sp. KY-GH-1]QEY16629.1 GNAT family N-acetyltransferase [Cellvibrio sp. KY-GH-1]